MLGTHVSQAGAKAVTNTVRATQSVTLGWCQFSDRIAVLKQDRKMEPDPKVLHVFARYDTNLKVCACASAILRKHCNSWGGFDAGVGIGIPNIAN